MDKQTVKDRAFEAAKKYVDQQLETMKESGSAPKQLSPADYEALIRRVASAAQ